LVQLAMKGNIAPMDEVWNPDLRTWSYFKNSDIPELQKTKS